jgi:hypothetical protein
MVKRSPIKCRFCNSDFTRFFFFRKRKPTGYGILREHVQFNHKDQYDEIMKKIDEFIRSKHGETMLKTIERWEWEHRER